MEETLLSVELVLKSYMPLQLEKGMLFLSKFKQDTRFETSELWELREIPKIPIEEFIVANGAPLELMLVDEDENIVATHEQIGWWDEGEYTDEYRDITLDDINMILNENDGMVNILAYYDDEEGEFSPSILLNKVILSDLQEEED